MSQSSQMFLAKALFDNVAETPDELAFRRGDVVTVLDQDTGGLEGWWLCSLKDRQGIAPANRLKILSGMGEGGGGGVSQDENVECRRNFEKSMSSSKVMTPVRKGDVYVYSPADRSMEDYDVPPSRYFPSSKEPSPDPDHDIYDTPTNLPVPATLPAPITNTNTNNSDDSFYDTLPASRDRTPPGSQRASMDSLSSASSHSLRLSADGSHTLPGSRRGSSECSSRRPSRTERVYNTPPGSKRASMERTLPDNQPIYDTPSPAEAPGEATYDTPNPSSRRQSRDWAGTDSRSSVLSSASSESCVSGSSSNFLPGSKAGSLPDSARSSMDASLQETYDLPSREARALTQLSMDSGLGLYDTPTLGRPQPPSPQSPHVPGSASHSQLSNYASENRPTFDIKRSHSMEHAIDDIYDSPKNNAPRIKLKSGTLAPGGKTGMSQDPNAVYDIPPQVTRDSVISARSDSSDDSVRLSSCSTDSRSSGPESCSASDTVHEELLLDLDSALELLVKRQQDVTRACSRLQAFVTPTWRSKESLQTHVFDVRMACGEVKKAVGDFVDFAQGTLANAGHVSDRKVMSRLVKQVTPLQQQRKSLVASIQTLEDIKWQVALLVEPVQSGSQDSLGNVVRLAQDIVPHVKKLASFIQSNGSGLFKRSSDFASDGQHVVSKPPIGPKSDLSNKSSGGGNGSGGTHKTRSVQHRPLPTPPASFSERPLPPTPPQHNLRDLELVGTLDNLSDYINVQGDRRSFVCEDDERDYSDLMQDYDYVNGDAPDAEGSQDQHKQTTKNNEQPEIPDTPTAEKNHFPDKPQDTFNENNKNLDTNLQKSNTVCHTEDKKHMDIDLVPTKDTCNDSFSQNKDQSGDQDWSEDLKTPMNKTNGFTIPDHPYPSGYVDLSNTSLSANDKQVLVYYSGQLETHATLLTNAIDAFFTCIENNEPPKVFISNSKFVIVTAHKLVFIGDALHRNLMNSEVRNKVMQCANHVCQCLKVSVQATKAAALQYPSVSAVQDMVDRVVDVSHAAHELKLVITQAAAL